MRVAFLCTSSLDYPSPRGRWLPVAEALLPLGISPTLLMLHHMADHLPIAQQQQQINGVPCHYVSQMHVYGPVGQRRYFGPAALLYYALRATLRFIDVIRQLQPEALHICKPQPINGLAGLLASRWLNLPLYVDCDDYEAGGNRFGAGWQQRMVQWWEDRLPQLAVGITVGTRYLAARNLVRGIHPDRIVYVPNGIRRERLTAVSAQQRAAIQQIIGPGEAPGIYVGTISQTTHHVGLLIDAFHLVVQQRPQARLLLVGEGEDRATLQRQAEQHGLQSHIRWTGAVAAEAIPAWLSHAAYSVDPVMDDNVARGRSPLKIVESLASGVPVITSNVGDRAETLDGAGILAPAGDPVGLADAILAILRHPQQQQDLAHQATRRAAQLTWDQLAQQWAHVYRLPRRHGA